MCVASDSNLLQQLQPLMNRAVRKLGGKMSLPRRLNQIMEHAVVDSNELFWLVMLRLLHVLQPGVWIVRCIALVGAFSWRNLCGVRGTLPDGNAQRAE